jgi:hypothetical protein
MPLVCLWHGVWASCGGPAIPRRLAAALQELGPAGHSGQVSAKEPGSFSGGIAGSRPCAQELLLLDRAVGESSR